MTPQPDNHTLNACLARVIGIKHEIQYDGAVTRLDAGHEFDIFNPINDPVEMEEVEAFIQAQHKIEYNWNGEYWYVTLDRWCLVPHRDKKRAFALAVQAMEQGKP